MMRAWCRWLVGVLGVFAALPGAVAADAGAWNPAPVIAAQREAMAKLAFMDGTWRGTASMMMPNGEKRSLTQTERVGPMLDGTLRVIEGRGYAADGSVAFNAFAIVSYDTQRRSYAMRSYAQGRAGDFVLTPTPDGFTWEIPAGPATIRYAAVIKDGTWRETGERIVPGQPPMRFFEMELRRIGDTGWPAGGAVAPK